MIIYKIYKNFKVLLGFYRKMINFLAYDIRKIDKALIE